MLCNFTHYQRNFQFPQKKKVIAGLRLNQPCPERIAHKVEGRSPHAYPRSAAGATLVGLELSPHHSSSTFTPTQLLLRGLTQIGSPGREFEFIAEMAVAYGFSGGLFPGMNWGGEDWLPSSKLGVTLGLDGRLAIELT